MAEAVIRHNLTEKEVDDLVAQELSPILITYISRKFMAFDIRDKLWGKKKVEISTPEIYNSIQRLCESESLEIRISNLQISTTNGAGYGLRVSCNVELVQK